MDVRIDKYLWAIRAYKTRNEAMQACTGGKVKLNDAPVKPAKTVRVGDIISVRKGAVQYSYKVVQPNDKRVGAALVPQYAEDLTPQSELDKLNSPVETFFVKRDRGAGRPTKKERRILDGIMLDVQDSFLEDDMAGSLSMFDRGNIANKK